VGRHARARIEGHGLTLRYARELYGSVRVKHGLPNRASALLTRPDANLKLNKSSVPAYGITLQHYVQKLSTGLTVNACPNAGDCTKVCVLDNGMGRYDSVQRGRRAKTEFLARYPLAFAFLLGHELALAVRRDGAILLRPNVNSDIEWEKIAPKLCDGETFGLHGAVRLYGYTKVPGVLDTNGWLGRAYRVAYSWNEHTPKGSAVEDFLARGGSVAVVTDRKPKSPINQWHSNYSHATVMDADLTDEWIFKECVIGDLSAKGKARKLIGKSGFVVSLSQTYDLVAS